MTVYCATTNPGKLREFRLAVERLGSADIVLEPLPELERVQPPDETGESFEQNAIQKALYYGALTDGCLFAEDSGLVVDALGGEPGIYSARYAGLDADDARNNLLLLERMAGKAVRTARYVCVVALARRGTLLDTFRGEVEGEILEEERGKNGFGYDPLFYYPEFGCTFGECAPERKLQVSHRARAVGKMLRWLAEVSAS